MVNETKVVNSTPIGTGLSALECSGCGPLCVCETGLWELLARDHLLTHKKERV